MCGWFMGNQRKTNIKLPFAKYKPKGRLKQIPYPTLEFHERVVCLRA